MEERKDIFDFIEKRTTETPDSSYFKNLANSVLDKVAEENEVSKAKVVPLYRRPVAWISGAAAAVLVAFLLIPNEQKNTTQTAQVDFNNLSKKEVLAYVDAHIEDFDEELILEFIPTKNLETRADINIAPEDKLDPIETIVETESKDLQKSLESISDEEIRQYLEEEGFGDDDENELFL